MTTTASEKITEQQHRSWRDLLPIHPAADLFPLMTEQELAELAKDIEANGLLEKIDLYRDRKTKQYKVLEGRNRLDALERLGREIVDNDPAIFRQIGRHQRSFDPFGYVCSKNLHRRHLTGEQKREIAAKLLAANPSRSNRQIAGQLGVSHHTVRSVRAEQEARGQIAHVDTVIDTKGRKQLARRQVEIQVRKNR